MNGRSNGASFDPTTSMQLKRLSNWSYNTLGFPLYSELVPIDLRGRGECHLWRAAMQQLLGRSNGSFGLEFPRNLVSSPR